MQQMKTILVPIDFSEVSEKTAATAFSLVQDIHVDLVFLHVMDSSQPIRVFNTSKAGASASSSPETLAAERLREWVRQAHAQGIIASYRLAHGSPIAQILQHAKQLRADLIVIGSHDYGSSRGSTVGSTTKGVLYATPCPIVVVPSDKAGVAAAGACDCALETAS